MSKMISFMFKKDKKIKNKRKEKKMEKERRGEIGWRSTIYCSVRLQGWISTPITLDRDWISTLTPPYLRGGNMRSTRGANPPHIKGWISTYSPLTPSFVAL
jgi:hypothetical protein